MESYKETKSAVTNSARGELVARLRVQGFNESYLTGIETGYCSDWSGIKSIQAWLKEEFPKLKEATATEIAWASALSNTLELRWRIPNINQNILLYQLANYLESNPYPHSCTQHLVKKLRSHGHCSGFAFFVAVACLLRSLVRKEGSVEELIQQSSHFIFDTFQMIRNWDGKSEFTQAQKRKINSALPYVNAVLDVIYEAQHSNSLHSIPQGDWDQLFFRLFDRLVAMLNLPKLEYRALHPLGTIVMPFTAENAKMAIDEFLLQSAEKPMLDEMKDDAGVEVMLICANRHASLVIKYAGSSPQIIQLGQYDSNNICTGLIPKVAESDILRDLVMLSHPFSKTSHSGAFAARIFGFSRKYRYAAADKLMRSINIDDLTELQKQSGLVWSILSGSEKCFHFWVKLVLNLNTRVPNYPYTFLHLATRSRRTEMVKQLLECKADTRVTTENSGATPLHYAVRYAARKEFQLLISAGADLFTTNKEGLIPLDLVRMDSSMYAEVYSGTLKQYEQAPSQAKLDLLFLATVRLKQIDDMQTLLSKGANVNASDLHGRGALRIAVDNDHVEAVALLKIYNVKLITSDSHILKQTKSVTMSSFLIANLVKEQKDEPISEVPVMPPEVSSVGYPGAVSGGWVRLRGCA